METKRIKFEPLQAKYRKDLEELFCKNNLVMQSTLKGRVFTKQEFEELLENEFIKNKEDSLGFWCVISKADNKLIGVSGLHKFTQLENANYEFGFILNPNYWGKGLATEIGNFWFDYAKTTMGLTQLIATVSPTNIASRRVLEKLNMEQWKEYKSKERGTRLVLRKNL